MSEPAVAPTTAPHPPRSRAAVRQAWAQRLARFPDSGLTPARFGAAEGVSLASFYAWKRRLATALPAPADPAAASGPRLLPVRLPAADAAVELALPGGAVLRLRPGCDLAVVRSLLDALGGPPC
jgi:hypothetical protein